MLSQLFRLPAVEECDHYAVQMSHSDRLRLQCHLDPSPKYHASCRYVAYNKQRCYTLFGRVVTAGTFPQEQIISIENPLFPEIIMVRHLFKGRIFFYLQSP